MNKQKLARLRRGLLFLALALALILLAMDRYAAWAHYPAKDSRQVVIYTTAWCPYCAHLRADLRASGVPYTEYDVEQSLDGQAGMWALKGRGVPVSAIGPEIVYGYQVDKIAFALQKLGYTYLPAPVPTRQP